MFRWRLDVDHRSPVSSHSPCRDHPWGPGHNRRSERRRSISREYQSDRGLHLAQSATGNLWVYYGYVNTGEQTSVPFGETNQVVPGIEYQGQPTVIDPGVYPSVFKAAFNQFAFESIAWELGGEAAVATAKSPEYSAGQTGPVSDVTATTATLNGTVVPDGTATTSHFEYGTSTSYGSTTASATPTGFSSQPTSAHIEGLTPGTTYHYRLDATTADLATTGSDGTFTTPPLPLALRLQETLAAAPKRSGRGKFSANFTVTNTDATYDATGVRVTEVLPADAAADLAISDPSCAIDGEGRVSCTVGTLAPGVSATVTIRARSDQGFAADQRRGGDRRSTHLRSCDGARDGGTSVARVSRLTSALAAEQGEGGEAPA